MHAHPLRKSSLCASHYLLIPLRRSSPCAGVDAIASRGEVSRNSRSCRFLSAPLLCFFNFDKSVFIFLLCLAAGRKRVFKSDVKHLARVAVNCFAQPVVPELFNRRAHECKGHVAGTQPKQVCSLNTKWLRNVSRVSNFKQNMI